MVLRPFELGTFSYFPLTITTGTDHEVIKAGDAEQTTSIVANSIRYLISPSAVTKEDIQAPEFLFEQAATRAARFRRSCLRLPTTRWPTES